jgi:hypothetical protein
MYVHILYIIIDIIYNMYKKPEKGTMFNQGLTYIENKLNKVSTVFSSNKEGFDGILGSHPAMKTKNLGEKQVTDNQVNTLNDNLAQYTTATTNLKNKTDAYLDDASTYSIKRNYNVFVNQYTEPAIESIARCVNVNALESSFSDESNFSAAYPPISATAPNFPNFLDARRACSTWAVDSGKGVFSLTKDATSNYMCKVGDDNQATTVQYTKPISAYPLNGATSTTANAGGLFANGRIGVYTAPSATPATSTSCKLSNMPAPYKIAKYNSGANNVWYNNGGWAPAWFPEPTAYWIWPDSNYVGLNGYYKYMYYSYNNTTASAITATVCGVADNYADLNLINILNGVATRTPIFRETYGQIVPQAVSLQPGTNVFEFQPGNSGGPAGLLIAVQSNLGNGKTTLFKSGDDGWGVSATQCTAADVLASNTVAQPNDPLNIKYFSNYDSTSAALTPYANCDPLNGGDIYKPSIAASFGRNCSNITKKPVMARYIKVCNRPDQAYLGSYMQIAQLVVMGYDKGKYTNLAANGRPGNTVGGSVTSTSAYSAAANAIDGNQSAKGWPNIFHSYGTGPGEYWYLDLGKIFPITQIVYYNRGDCCQLRATGMTIELWNIVPTAGQTPSRTLALSAALKQTFNMTATGADVDCSIYTDTDTNLPRACIAQIASDVGCTSPITDRWYSDFSTLAKKDIVWWSNRNSKDPTPSVRTECYGADQTKWPAPDCTIYGANDINVPKACMVPLWKAAGCTTEFSDDVAQQWQPFKKSVWTSWINLASTAPAPSYRNWCYGTDQTKWPATTDANNYKQVSGNNGTVSCDRYCAGYQGGPWNNELSSWGGAYCVAAGINNDEPCAQVKGSSTKCLCKRNDAGPWAQ